MKALVLGEAQVFFWGEGPINWVDYGRQNIDRNKGDMGRFGTADWDLKAPQHLRFLGFIERNHSLWSLHRPNKLAFSQQDKEECTKQRNGGQQPTNNKRNMSRACRKSACKQQNLENSFIWFSHEFIQQNGIDPDFGGDQVQLDAACRNSAVNAFCSAQRWELALHLLEVLGEANLLGSLIEPRLFVRNAMNSQGDSEWFEDVHRYLESVSIISPEVGLDRVKGDKPWNLDFQLCLATGPWNTRWNHETWSWCLETIWGFS